MVVTIQTSVLQPPYNYGSSFWGSKASCELHLIASSSHLSAETTHLNSYFAKRKRCQNIFTVVIINWMEESAAKNVEVDLDTWALKLSRRTATTRDQDRLFYSPGGPGLE
jgi:hypothetical protein